MIWLIDPVTGKKSVSLSCLIAILSITAVLGVLNAFEVVKNVSIFLELTGMFAALYFGRRNIQLGGKTAAIGDALPKEEEQK